MDFSELWAIFGPGIAGAVFGAGWWFWVDAVVCSSVKVSFLHYLPGKFNFILLKNECFWLVDWKIVDWERIWSGGVIILSSIMHTFYRNFCFFGGFDVQLCEEGGYWLLTLRRWRVEVSINLIHAFVRTLLLLLFWACFAVAKTHNLIFIFKVGKSIFWRNENCQRVLLLEVFEDFVLFRCFTLFSILDFDMLFVYVYVSYVAES